MDLTSRVGNVTFKNPVAVSAGVTTRSLYGIRKCVEAGVGAVCTKSISFIPADWPLPRPAIWLFDHYGEPDSCTNIELGFLSPEQGEEFVGQIKPITKGEGVVLIANINLSGDLGSFTEEEAIKHTEDLARKLEAAGADMIEISRSCPVVAAERFGGDWSKVADEVTYIEKLLRTLKSAISIPFFLKMLPITVAFATIEQFEDAGVSTHHVLPCDLPGTVIDIETGRPIIPSSMPYLGQGIKAYANYWTTRFASKAKCPVMTSGGVMNSRDVIERLMCGATIVQSQTAVMHYGPKVLTEMIDGLEGFMLRKGYESLKDIVGIAVPHVDNTEEFAQFIHQRQVSREAMTMAIDRAECVGCSDCTVCPYGALSEEAGFSGFWSSIGLYLHRLNPLNWIRAFEGMGELPLKLALRRIWHIPKHPKWDEEKCEFCGICQSLCLTGAIRLALKT